MVETQSPHIAFCTFVRFVLALDLSVSSSSLCLGRAVVCDYGTPWTFLLPFFVVENQPSDTKYSIIHYLYTNNLRTLGRETVIGHSPKSFSTHV